jgi:outer membrane protein assembly factor BamB
VLIPRTTRYSVVGAAVACVTALAIAQEQPSRAAIGRDPLDPRWRISFEATVATLPGFDREMAYVPLATGELVAVNLDEGSEAWRAPIAAAHTPAAGDGLVFVDEGTRVRALEQRTGTVVWDTALDESLGAPLFWEAGWLMASTARGDLVALEGNSGRIRWRAPLGSPLVAAPGIGNDRLFAALGDRRVVALQLAAGTVAWSTALDQTATGLLVLDDQLLVGSRANRLHSLSLDTGRVRWAQRAAADVAGRPAADDEHIYFAALDNVLRALDRDNGNLRWRRNLPSRPRSGPLRSGDLVLVPLVTTDIVAYAAANGADALTIRAAAELGGPPLVRMPSRPTAPRLIAIGRDGSLEAFAARVEPPPAPLKVLPGREVGH